VKGKYARGEAEAVGMEGPLDKPLPNGMAWNMVYDNNAAPGEASSATHEQLWSRLKFFLDELIPVAEEAGVKLAAHPDDPPMAFVRAQPRLVWQPQLYQKLIDLKPSRSNALEFCVGTLAEIMKQWKPTAARKSWLTFISATFAERCRSTRRRSLTTAKSMCCACCGF
jgi:mannonate dehydratase